MSKGQWGRTQEVYQSLIEGLQRGRFPSGSRFYSGRGLADRYGISYQTADRLIRLLCAEGWLNRNPSSGTFVSSKPWRGAGALLLFHERAQRPESFGFRLLHLLGRELKSSGVEYRTRFLASDETWSPADDPDAYPLLWEFPSVLKRLCSAGGSGLLLHARPSPGIESIRIDSVSVDDYVGGRMAAQLLAHCDRVAVIGGPARDHRSQDRIAGFRSLRPAQVFHSGWFVADGLAIADRVLDDQPDGVFCANDRLAQALLRRCSKHKTTPPAVVGFDNAPIATKLALTTIAIPWEELVSAAAQVVKRRLSYRPPTATHHHVTPCPIIRTTCSRVCRVEDPT